LVKFILSCRFPFCFTTLFNPSALYGWRLTWWRLGVVAASTELPAGQTVASLHCTFCGLLPPLRQTARCTLCFFFFLSYPLIFLFWKQRN